MSKITIYEHQHLRYNTVFNPKHGKALLKLNELHSFNYLEATANGVKFKSYVGIVQIDGLVIEILPKIDHTTENKRTWRNVLIDMLQACGKIKARDINSADVKRRNSNLLEIYFEMFLNEIDELLRKGLAKKYRIESSNVFSLKGKLQLAEHIRHNIVHKERFYTSHQIYDHDHLIHQILRKAIEILKSFTRHSYLASFATRMDLAFPHLKTTHIGLHSFNKIKLSRKTAQYEKALSIARIIIENYSPSIDVGRTNMIALLFNMNNLWEEYIYTSLRKESIKNPCFLVQKQATKMLFDTSFYRLKPDIVLTRKTENEIKTIHNETFIIDTKWKVPKNEKANNADLRQIYTYNRFWDAKKGILLYPGDSASHQWMTYQDQENTFQCKLVFIDILSQGMLKKNLGKEIMEVFN